MPAQDRTDRTFVGDWSVTTVHPCGPTIIQPHGEADLDVTADLQAGGAGRGGGVDAV